MSSVTREGRPVVIVEYLNLGQDCRQPDLKFVVTREPENGALSRSDATASTGLARDLSRRLTQAQDPRLDCPIENYRSLLTTYAPKPGFVGRDTMAFDIVYRDYVHHLEFVVVITTPN